MNNTTTIMEKTKLKKQLEDTKAKIKANSKDAHFADALISDLLSIKGQLEHEPTLVYLPLSDVEASVDGEHYEVSLMKDGTAVYHTRGGYTIIADYRITGLNYALRSFLYDAEGLDSLTEADREAIELDLSANAYVLNIPMIAFSDAKFKLEMATKTVEYLNKTYEEAINAPLQDDDVEANEAYKEAVLVADKVKHSVEQ